MKFQFQKNLDYQVEAVNAVVDLFDMGSNTTQKDSLFEFRGSLAVVSNKLELDEKRILENIRFTQKKHKISPVASELVSHDYTVEMETGTGKTYVYLRTIHELHKRYGLTKFIILVPSVAIREGVMKTIEQTKDHFAELYDHWSNSFVYDSSKLSQVKEFATSLDPQIMIMTIQSFNTDTTVMRQSPDRFNGESPLELIADTRPIVIMDEPQNMKSDLAKSAINDLNPLMRLRYSATHVELHNLVYRLTPVDALKKGLVKKIQVWGVSDDNPNEMKFKLSSFITKKGQAPKATAFLIVKNAQGEYIEKECTIAAGDDLFAKTRNNTYQNILVNEINARDEYVELSSGKKYTHFQGEESNDVVFRVQIRETIKAHIARQMQMGKNMKVLSLFFIDHVDNYIHKDSKIRLIFEEEYEKITKEKAENVHTGYFAKKKEKGQEIIIDSRGDGKADKAVYDLIMKNKERLLSFDEPVSYIFTHSALKEGWDNPNIFQICTLRDSTSVLRKRQEIGRGMRLPVTVNGERVCDQNTAVLTVIANESYRTYVSRLQEEYQEAGYGSIPEPDNARGKRIVVKTTKYLESTDFVDLWRRISKRTRFWIEVQNEVLITKIVERLSELSVHNIVVKIEKVDLFIDDKGKFKTTYLAEGIGEKITTRTTIKNLVDRIATETGLTKKSILTITERVNNLDLYITNPEEYTRSMVMIVNLCKQEELINSGLKYIPTGDMWEAKLLYDEFEEFEKKVIASDKSPYTHTPFDSDGERNFAMSLQNNSNIKVFTKLPRGFVVDTPLGNYTPDWALVWHDDEGDKLYLVRETKFGYANINEDLTLEERLKIICGKKHFDSIGVNYKVVQAQDLSDLK